MLSLVEVTKLGSRRRVGLPSINREVSQVAFGVSRAPGWNIRSGLADCHMSVQPLLGYFLSQEAKITALNSFPAAMVPILTS